MAKRKASAVNEEGSSSNNTMQQPKQKRARTARSSTTPRRARRRDNKQEKRRPGKTNPKALLQRITEAPLDIVLEIFQHLETSDLLRLARTTKDIRRLLTSKSSISVWQAALQKEQDLPPIPEDMSEPAYANLLYSAHCHECLRPNCTKIHWQCRVRICGKCEKDVFLKQSELDFEPDPPFVTKADFLALVPHVNLGPELPRRYYYLYQSLSNLFSGENSDYWLESIVQDYLEEYENEVKDQASADIWRVRLQKEYKALSKHAAQCREWYFQKTSDRAEELELLRRKRRHEIVERLGLSRNDRLRHDPAFVYHDLVDQPKDLTDKEWERISPYLRKFFRLE